MKDKKFNLLSVEETESYVATIKGNASDNSQVSISVSNTSGHNIAFFEYRDIIQLAEEIRVRIQPQPPQGNAEVLVKALERISHPIMHLRADLKEGEQLNGQYAIQLSNDPEYLKGIAREALASYNTGKGDQEVKK